MIVFAGIEVNQKTRDLCESLQGMLKMRTAGSYPRRENFHVTLAYFGEVDEGKRKEIQKIMEETSFTRNELLFTRLGVFGGGKGDQIVLLARPQDALLTYREELIKQFGEKWIYTDSKPFRPHVTLVRAKKKMVDCSGISFEPTSSPVEKVVLFRSYERFGKRIYEPLGSYHAGLERL